MRTKLIILLLLLTSKYTWSQTTFFSENMGNPSGNTLIANNTFQNSGSSTYSNGAQTNSADVRTSSPSTNSYYSGASGFGNVYFSSTSGAYGFAIENINASNYNSLSLKFGYKKEAAAAHATFSVDYWNGTSWTTLANTASTLFNELAGAPAVWYLSKSLSLPADAQINGLKIRFVKTGTVSIRIDDVKLSGIETAPTVTNTAVASITNNSAAFAGNVSATGGSTITATGTLYAPTASNANPILGGSSVITVSTTSPNGGTGSFSNSSGTALLPNVQYSYNAYATKSTGLTGYGTVATFYTLAVTPVAPIVSSPTGNSLNVTIGSDTNSSITTYAILETTTNTYVQANGTLAGTSVYQTAGTWGTKTVTGLSPTTNYTFKIAAKNGGGITTATGSSTSSSTTILANITASGTLSALSTIYGAASYNTNFSFSGTNLTGNVVITPPAGFEISITTGGGSGYAASQTITPSSGIVSSTTVYVRLAATASAGTHDGNISLVSASDGIVINVATVSSWVAQLELTISGITALNKTYDGNTTAVLTGTPVLNGVVAGDSGNLSLVTTSVIANFDDELVGIDKAVIVNGYSFSGTAANNYTLTQPIELWASITPNAGSDIILNSSSPTNSNSNIDYTLYQGTTLTNTGTGTNGSVGVLGFYVRDGGATMNDADNLPTELKAISFDITNPSIIRSVRLFVGSSPRGTPVMVNGASVINLTGLTNIVAPDDDKLAVSLRITYKSFVLDNVQAGFTISNVSANNSSSMFSTFNGGGISSVITGDVNRIEVAGNHLEFIQQPSNSYTNTNMNPFPTVRAKDPFENIDLDVLNNVVLTSSGALNTSPQLPNSFSNGIYEFTTIKHNTPGTGLILTASLPGLSSINSSTFIINSLIVPTFTAVSPICAEDILSVLPTTSNNGITGVWSPALDNTQTTTYTFTPNPGQNASVKTLTIVVNQPTTPTFSSIAPIYSGATLSPLPVVSLNGIIGTWSPALNNTATTTYTFTPTNGQCASGTTLIITVNSNTDITPTFNAVGPICSGRFLSLPTTSTNNIVGVWSPAIDNTATTTYTFTPNPGQGALNATMTVTVNPTITPTFSSVTPINSGGTLSALPIISNNGYHGSWTPALDNHTTTTYLFTPTSGGCITTTTLTIVVSEPVVGEISGTGGTTGSNSPTAQKYHDTQGKLEVSETGSAVYNLPIAMPPSIQNVGPIINLTYSSGQMSGIAGQGWSINSISNISRIATRRDIDGFIDGVDFDNNDKLALNGQRLLLVPGSGSYWGNGSVYQTETQSNTRIELFGTGANVYFIVTAPDGSRSWFGNYGGENGVDNTAYYITRFEDTNGNYIKYHYYKPYNKGLCIQNIQFSANSISGILPQNSIFFRYKEIKRTENAYIKGIKQEKGELLYKIDVYAGEGLFRKYELTHVTDPELAYEKVSSIQEFNGAGEAANPVEFTYDETVSTNVGSDTVVTYNNNIDFDDVKLAGDFDGDGRLDFMTNTEMYLKNFENSTPSNPITLPTIGSRRFLASTLKNNKLNQYQTIVTPTMNIDNIVFKYYGYNPGTNSVGLEDTKTIAMDNSAPCSNACENSQYIDAHLCDDSKKKVVRYLDGDFNGDGITEVIVMRYDESFEYGLDPDPTTCLQAEGEDPICLCSEQHHYISEFPSETFMVNLDSNASTTIGDAGVALMTGLNISRTSMEETFVNDYNGDGKSDLLAIKPSGAYRIFTFNQLTVSPWVSVEIIGSGVIATYSDTKQILFGDFNGDGKTDIMLPATEGGPDDVTWDVYYSNPNPAGGNYFVQESHDIVRYWPNSGSYFSSRVKLNSYYAMDVNKDGKSDLVRIELQKYSTTWDGYNTKWRVETYINNIQNTTVSGNKFTLDYTSPCTGVGIFQDCDHNSNSPEIPIPLVASYNRNGINNEILIIRNHYNDLTYVKFSKDVSRDATITKVTSSGGNIVDDIFYSPLVPDTYGGLGSMSDFYSSGDSVNYPLVEIKQLPASKAVSLLKNTVQGVIKRQYFKYHGFIADMNGMGATGFRKTARSAWFNQTSDKLIWTVSENDPNLRGAMIRTYTQLINNGISSNFSFVNSGNPAGIINQMTNNYYNNTTNGIFTMYVNTHTVEDFLSNVKNEVNYTYFTPFILEDTVISKNYLSGALQGTTTVVKEYDNNPTGSGSAYYIGRPAKITTTIAAYSDTSSTEQKFTYTGNRLTKTEKKANNTDGVYITEEYEYFASGNLKKKILSAPGATPPVSPRITEFTYDTSDRFVKTFKDIEGLITTSNSFDPLYGLVISTTNPLGLTAESTYDNWGKRIKETDYLGKNTYYTYSKSNGFYSTQQMGDDGSRSISVTDALGREVRNGSLNINSVMTYYNTEYDFMNRKKRKSQPYLNSSTPNQWSTFSYDEYSRVIQTVIHTGLTTNISYSGLTVTSSDGTKTTTATKNANGHLVTTSDSGGTITNNFTADGNLKSTTYDSTTISIEYDGWGRKTKLTDPSAGIYQYECNAYGEVTKEITPKGSTTYTLLPSGKIDYKTSLGSAGDNTNTKTTNSYDSTTKLLTQTRFDDYTNGYFTIYNYQYDAYNRLIFKDESGSLAYYQQATQYDAFGRIEKQLYSATNTSDGKQSTKWIKNTYKNGFQWQIKDDASGQVLWQSNNVNARGQIETAIMGNGTAIINMYDQYGFPSQFKHDLSASGANIMTLNTTFEPLTANLTHRYNSLFNRTEDYQYDNLFDRLTDYPDALGQNVHQSYQNDGRIQQNNLGAYSYDSSKKYQNNSIALTDNNIPYFINRTGIFNDDMEAKTGWLISEPTVVTYDITTAKTGTTSLKIQNSGSSEKVVQSALWTKIDNAAPTEYTYSGWVKGTGSDAEMFLYMKTANETAAYTQTDQIISPATGSNWVYFEKTVLIPANIKKICLRLDNNGAGTVWFDDLKIRKTTIAVDAVRELNISYNMFNDPVQIEETNVDKISFDYNYNNNRSTMYYGGLETDKMQRQYRKHYSEDGSMEIKQNMLTGEVEFVTYIGGDGYSASVVLKSDGTTPEYLYLHRDYQGSIVAITDGTGSVVEKRLYDAWGAVLQIQDGQGNSLAAFSVLDRGYTGHEHLQSVGLINMNGRLYDPKVHRFLQTDNFVQDPTNTQNFNRYGYVLNNPLKYTDPSGEFLPFLAVVGIGILIAALTYTITAILSNTPFSCDGLIQSCAIGAFTAAVTFGIGSACSSITNFYMEACVESFSNGVFQGGMSGLQGGNFWSGFAAGALASVASSAWKGGSSAPETYSFGGYSTTIEYTHQGISGALGMNNSWGLLVFGTVSGGAGAELTGGNFWQGAVTGLVVSGLNHLAHEEDTTEYKKGLFEFTADYTKVPLPIDQEVSSYSMTGWHNKVLETKILTVAAAGAASTLSNDFGLGRTSGAIFSMATVDATGFTSQYNIRYANVTQKLWYGKVTFNLFSGEITNVNFKSLISTEYKIMTTLYQRVIYNLTGRILTSDTTHYNQLIQVFHNPLPTVGANIRK